MGYIRNLLCNSVALNIPKNLMQFIFGFILLTEVYPNEYSILKLILGASGFCIALSFVYLFNDLTDCEEDKKSSMKYQWKPIANGTLTKENANRMMYAFLFVGLAMAFICGFVFFILTGLVIALNILYSHPSIRLKKNRFYGLSDMVIIQTLKFSSGWFLFTETIKGLPILLVLSLSIIYSLAFLYYKNNTENALVVIKENKRLVIPMSIIAALCIMVSFTIYKFQEVFILMGALGLVTALAYISSKKFLGNKVNFVFIYVTFVLLLASFWLKDIPAVSARTEAIVDYSNILTDIIKDKI